MYFLTHLNGVFNFTGSLEGVLLMRLIRVQEGFPLLTCYYVIQATESYCLSPPRIRRSRSRSRSYSPSYSRRNGHGDHSDEISKPKIEYITEFGGSGDVGSPKFGGYSPPRSPPSQTDLFNRSEHSTSSSCKDTHLLSFSWSMKTFVV